MTINEKFMIDRQGKTFVLYAGLLEEAHDNGLVSIETEILEYPWNNGQGSAVVHAKVLMAHPSMGMERPDLCMTFTGIGDASPDNVSRNIAPHLIRMAETRAKARALRDAINVGVTALEELDEGDGSSGQAQQASSGNGSAGGGNQAKAQPRQSSNQQSTQSGGDDELSSQMKDRIRAGGETLYGTLSEMESHFNIKLDTMTASEGKIILNTLVHEYEEKYGASQAKKAI